MGATADGLLGEGMAKGHITVGGYAGMSCGAAMIGGTIHVKGDAAAMWRCDEGRQHVVEGKIGYQSGFMAHSGKIIALGGAGAPCADALWKGEVWVAGEIESLGVDVNVIEPTAEEVAEVMQYLILLTLKTHRAIGAKWFRANALDFESRDASAWLMI